MKTLTPAHMRAFLPACPPWRPLLAFVLVVAAAVLLLEHGVRDVVLPIALATTGWLTTTLTGASSRVRVAVIP